MKPEIGTPCGSSQLGAMDGHWLHGTVKRELGWAAGAPPGVHGLPCQSSVPAGASRADPFPPGLLRRRHRHIGEDGVRAHHLDAARVGGGAGIRRHAEEAALRVDGAELALGVDVDPGDVVAERPRAVAGQLRDDHGEIGLAGRARHGPAEVGDAPLGVLHAEDEHVLGHPAFLPRLVRADAERVALLAEERIAAVARAHAPDELLLREVEDEPPVRREVAHPVQARDEVVVGAHVVDGDLPHARHDVHARHHVGAVRDHDARAAGRRAGRPHEVRDDPHAPVLHAVLEVGAGLGLGLGGAIQLLVGPASSLSRVQMKVSCSVRATSWGWLRCR